MSLDFVRVRSHGQPRVLSEIKEDAAFKRNDYTDLAERLFGPVPWIGGTAIAVRDEMSFELTPHDSSLSVTARGPGDTVAFMDNISALAVNEGVVTIDVQGSEIMLPFNE